MKEIDINETIFNILKAHPEFKDILFELGFTDIIKPGMIQTMGRIMTLKKGSQAKQIPMEKIKALLVKKGYTLKESL